MWSLLAVALYIQVKLSALFINGKMRQSFIDSDLLYYRDALLKEGLAVLLKRARHFCLKLCWIKSTRIPLKKNVLSKRT